MFLAIDTVFDQCSVAVVSPDLKVLSCETQTGKREQTQQILPMIDTALKHANLKLSQITALIFNRGPGAFSGIRINTAVVQALAVAHDIPCVGVSSLAAIAQLAYDKHGLQHVYAAHDARMKQVYFAEYVLESLSHPLTEVQSDSALVNDTQLNSVQAEIMVDAQKEGSEKLVDYDAKTEQSIAIVGDGATLLSAHSDQLIISENIKPDAVCLAKLGVRQFLLTGGVSAEQALPVYLRNNAWKTLKEQGK